jgi:hypothetical protein
VTDPEGDLRVDRLDDGYFAVEVRQGADATEHRVRVPMAMVERLGLTDVDQEDVVRASMAFLLEREPATSILPEFGLDIIPRYFPDYAEELPARLGR